ncbi:sensor histidine kinase KdpD [Streptomyces sp. ISL-1]|uniref:sensor histidine kinase n=1 Tax=Streptomyces sp. ISL-1 TaxID=2817657 RepID=UPI0020355BB4|nr:ATP-binding protein [Streptomyces sp. ISL-1]
MTSVDSKAWHVPDTLGEGGKAVDRHMVLLAVLPAGLVTITGAAAGALLFTAGVGHVDKAAFWVLLTGELLLICAILMGAGLFASTKARAVARRYTELSLFAARGQAELAKLRQQMERGQELIERQRQQDSPLPVPTGDAPDRLGHEVASAQRAAEATAVDLAARSRGGEQFEVFANLARRLESLVHREIGLLDDLENEVENPDLLKGLFHVDHLATRIRRYAENLAVLGGAVSYRQWTRPVSMSDVLRSAAAEIEQYSRVKMVPPVDGTVSGHAVVDVVHLLAELVENATVFSPPQTQVLLRAEHVTAGLAVQVEDRGLGMTSTERNQTNALLASPDGIALGERLQDGRIGLYVVSVLARRHGIAVQLKSNIYGGTEAVVVLPHELLGRRPDVVESQQQPSVVTPSAPHGHVDDSAEQAVVRDTPIAPGPVPTLVPAPVPAPAPVAGPPFAPVASPAPEVGRPVLPKRRRQEHLSPQLRQPSHAAAAPKEVEHDPGLMAAFQTGVRLAEEAEETGTSPSLAGHTRPDPAP